ncbi:MAG: hypothetical protein AAFV95_24785 [Bacteroidota bacterium]
MKKESNQNRIRDAYDNQPVSLDKAELWQAIESELPPEEKERKFLLWWFAGAALLGIALLLIFLPGPTQEAVQPPSSAFAQKPAQEPLSSPSDAPVENALTKEAKTEAAKDVVFSEASTDSKENRTALSTPPPQTPDANPSTASSSSGQNQQAVIAMEDQTTAPSQKPKAPLLTSNEVADKQDKNTVPPRTAIGLSPAIQFKNPGLLPTTSPEEQAIPTVSLPDWPPKTQTPKWQMSLSAGYLSSRRQYNSGNATVRNLKEQNETELPGWGMNYLVQYRILPKLSIGLGLEYQQLRERIDWEGVTDVRQTAVESDSASFFIYQSVRVFHPGTLSRTETDYTRLRDYNDIHRLSLPIELQFDLWQRGKWGIGLQAGGKINLINWASGRFVTADDEVLDVQRSKQLFRKRGGHALYGGLRLAYRLGQQWGISWQGQYERQLSDVYREGDFGYRYGLWAQRLGVNWRF